MLLRERSISSSMEGDPPAACHLFLLALELGLVLLVLVISEADLCCLIMCVRVETTID